MTTCTTCPYCGVGCGVLASPDGTIKGDPDHPANFGRLCSKGSALGETIDLDGRLLTPMIDGKEADWDNALQRVADEFTSAINEHGPDSVAFYVSGQLLTEDYYVANKLMKGFIGSANIDTNSRLCMASSVAGHKRAFGTDTVPGTYSDLEEADLIILVGSNLAWCHPVLHQRILAAKQARPNLTIVNVDPRHTATSELADHHLGISADGDIALFNGLLAYLADTQKIDLPFVHDHVNGCRDAIQAARASEPTDSGLDALTLQNFYRMWAETEKVVTVYSQGVNQSSAGTDKVNAILNCHLATGRIGKPGMGPFSVTGQPNAMGGREVGGLANMLANHLDIENPDHRAAVQTFWNAPTICDSQGLKAVDLFEACASGRIKALWVMSTNPAVSLPSANNVAEAIANVPFTVVTDIIEKTDTGDLADVLLPATGWGEKDGTITNSERRISRQRAFLPAPGKARPDWQIISDVAARMGWAKAFTYSGPDDIFAEYVALSDATQDFGRDLDLSGFAGLDYDTLQPRQWPEDDRRFFADGKFYHPDGRAKMLPITAPAIAAPEEFRLNTGRIRDQWHTMTRTGKSPRLGGHLAEPFVEIHPEDASQLGLAATDIVTLTSGANTAHFRARITPGTPKGSLFAPMHWTRRKSAASWVNGVVDTTTDPTSGQPASKAARVSATRFQAAWHGYLATSAEIAPMGDYAAVARTNTGWQAELAGLETPGDWAGFVTQLTGIEEATIAVVEDPKQGACRLALSIDGTVVALFFASQRPVALSRPHVIAQIGKGFEGIATLAGFPGAGVEDPGALVCSCMNVGRNTLEKAIAGGAVSVDALGACTGAGTSCGSCRPELAALIAAMSKPLAAE